jgi:hypothetical protein
MRKTGDASVEDFFSSVLTSRSFGVVPLPLFMQMEFAVKNNEGPLEIFKVHAIPLLQVIH